MSVDLTNIENNISMMVGGNFTLDSLGSEIYNKILEQVRSRAQEYIGAFETRFLGENFDALLQSNLHLSALLNFLVDEEPELVHRTIERLLHQYNSVLVLYDSADNKQAVLDHLPEEKQRLIRRLERRRGALENLLQSKP